MRHSPKGHCPEALHIEVVELLSQLIPEGTTVVFLGDGEFDGTDLQRTLQELGWSYVCRTAMSTTATWNGQTFRLDTLGACLKPGRLIELKDVQFTRDAYGPIMVLCCWAQGSALLRCPSRSPFVTLQAFDTHSLAEATMLGKVFARFVEQSPISVMVRGTLERVLGADQLDAWFARTAQQPDTRTVLFATVYDIRSPVVCRIKPSGRAAYRDHADQVGASLLSLYNQRNGVETHTSAALVRSSASALTPLSEQREGARAPWLPGYRVPLLDGRSQRLPVCLAG